MAYKSRVSDAVIRRLPMYYRHLRELEHAGVVRISSQELGEKMNLTASQIRQDINCFGGFGQQGYGYHVANLKEHIAEILGLRKQYHVIIVGAGNIGRAVANYPRFAKEGFNVQAIFDVSAALVGIDVHGILVQPMEKLEGWLEAHQVDIAVLAVPASCAQDMADRLAKGNVRGIWNFAPVDLSVPEGVAVNNVHLSDSLNILSYRMNEKELFERIDAERKG
ncbi:MAG: redox-sensing transcriptional repressor Rex [Clostridia bacterium]|nr:redox-sensing transcriptional repressor Rex [Clostridia bacterium]